MNLLIPDVVANAAAACGAGEWLRDLPGLIAELEAGWSVSVGRPFPHASEAFVAEARLADGTPAVLKLLIPQDGAAGRHEITMLRLTGGRGCAGLLRDDAARGALLLERLGPSLYELGHPLAERLEILVTAAATVWRPAPGRACLLERTRRGSSPISSPLGGRNLAIRALRPPSSMPWPARHNASLHTTMSGPYWCTGMFTS